MSSVRETSRLTCEQLQQAIHRVDPTAFLIPRRVLRRIIRQSTSIMGFGARVPHQESYLIDRKRLLDIVDYPELELEPGTRLSAQTLLLSRPEPEDLEETPAEEMLQLYWRRLFHIRIHAALQERINEGLLTEGIVRGRIHTIGQTEFDEIRAVLQKEHLVLPPRDDRTFYIEFAATYLELRHFADWILPAYFPGIRDPQAIEAILAEDVNDAQLYLQTRLEGASDPEPPSEDFLEHVSGQEVEGPDPDPEETPELAAQRAQITQRRLHRFLLIAEEARLVKNFVRASLYRFKAAQLAEGEMGTESRIKALDEIQSLAKMLQKALDFDKSYTQEWASALLPLVRYAQAPYDTSTKIRWTAETRLLYDLQSACIDAEREHYSVDLVEFFLWRGQRPLKRRLPTQHPVLLCRHLNRAWRRLPVVRMRDEERKRLSHLLAGAIEEAEQCVRDKLRPRLTRAFNGVPLQPHNLAEHVSYDKLIEELLDVIVAKGFLSFGDVRDAISRNSLKLSDLTSQRELFTGDQLLKLDVQLAIELDGTYRRAEAYLRWQQTFSSLGFGTWGGRFMMKNIAIPYVGAILLVGFADYLVYHLIEASHYTAGMLGKQHAEEELHSKHNESATGAEHTRVEPPQAPATEVAAAAKPALPQFDLAFVEQEGQTTAVLYTVNQVSSTNEQAAEAQPSEEAEEIWQPMSPLPEPPEEEPPPEEEAPVAETDTEPVEQATQVVVVDDHATALAESQKKAEEKAHGVGLLNVWTVLLFGTFLLMLLRSSSFREMVLLGLRKVFKALKVVIYDVPKKFFELRWVRKILQSRPFRLIGSFIIKPLILTIPLPLVFSILRLPFEVAQAAYILSFFALTAFLNSRAGRDLEETINDWVSHSWDWVVLSMLPGLIRWTLDIFKRMLEAIEKVLYIVDEWLRFRSGESTFLLIAKIIAGSLWFFVHYIVRFFAMVLLEPQINPVKHFPVVTVSHKLMVISFIPALTVVLTSLVGASAALWIAFFTQLLLPGAFGFIVWELKENWKLYESNRPEDLQPALVGSHGETVLRLLRPGFHSGTIPALFGKLRHAEQNAYRTGHFRESRKCREKLRHVEHDLKVFLYREFISLLRRSEQWQRPLPEVGQIEMSVNRIRIELKSPEIAPQSVWLVYEEQSGWLLASLEGPGWIEQLDNDERMTFSAALAGLYKLSSVHLIREQIESQLKSDHPRYDISERGLIVWPFDGYETAVTYDLQKRWRISPKADGNARSSQFPTLEAHQFVFAKHIFSWSKWVAFWEQPAPNPVLYDDMVGEVRVLAPQRKPVVPPLRTSVPMSG